MSIFDGLGGLPHLVEAATRSISAENPTGGKGAGARAAPGDDAHCTDAARELGRGWKVRPCLRNIVPGASSTLADIEGPGVIQHIWCTVQPELASTISLRIFFEGLAQPSVDVPLGDFFVNGIDGLARIQSIPIAVNPRGGMNSYWPMPFRRHARVVIANDGTAPIPEFFYQVTYALQDVGEDVGIFHAAHRAAVTTQAHPEHVIVDDAAGPGHYVGTALRWQQRSPGWWGEGEVKFFLDGDAAYAPTICGTGTEDYFGGAWGFTEDEPTSKRPVTYTGPYLGYPKVVFEKDDALHPARHAFYRWHIPDPIRFERDLRVTVQALGWKDDGVYRALTDEIASVGLWYARAPG